MHCKRMNRAFVSPLIKVRRVQRHTTRAREAARRCGQRTAAAPTRASQASYAWPALVHTEPMNTKVLRSAISAGFRSDEGRVENSMEAGTQRRGYKKKAGTAGPPVGGPPNQR